MEIYKSEQYLKERLLNEAKYPYYLSQRLKTMPLDNREAFCVQLHQFCKNLYEGNVVNKHSQNFNNKLIKQSDGWYHVKESFGEGKFINANNLLGKKIYCRESNCHLSAYNFALNFKGKIDIVFGTINPFNLKEGLFHSVCEFKLNNKELIFDGANYVVMDKALFIELFRFNALQRISKNELIKDKKELSSKTVIKNKKPYKIAQIKLLIERFYGLGFLVYLYNRQDFLENTEKQIKNIRQVKNNYNEFESKLKKIEESYLKE